MQLLQPLIPALQELQKEGEQGRLRLNRYQLWLTIPLAYLQAYGQTLTLERTINPNNDPIQSLFRTRLIWDRISCRRSLCLPRWSPARCC